MASEALQLPYAWGPGAGGAVGYLNPDKPDSVCGGLLHLDETWRPFWFNSGVVKNKYRPEGQETFEFTHYAQDRTFVNLRWCVFL